MQLLINVSDLRVFRTDECKGISKGSVVSVGTFDGVHRGHSVILQRMKDAAAEGLDAVIVTFEPHPRITLNKEPEKLRLLNTMDEKLQRFAIEGIDNVCIIPFTPEFARTPYEIFIGEYLSARLSVKKIIVGYDHRFGEKRSGNFDLLQVLSPKFGYRVEEVPSQYVGDLVVSSTKIRNMLGQHRIREATLMLGYHYPLSGKVIKGKGLGHNMGYPTANLEICDTYKLIPADGVYLVSVSIEGKKHSGMCNIGIRPTLSTNERAIEVHILDFESNLYGQILNIEFRHFIREEIKFGSLRELKEQLVKDEFLIRQKSEWL